MREAVDVRVTGIIAPIRSLSADVGCSQVAIIYSMSKFLSEIFVNWPDTRSCTYRFPNVPGRLHVTPGVAMDQQVAKIFARIAAESQDRLDVRSLRDRISGAGSIAP